MKTFPMFLKMEDRRVVVIGGGEQAAQKCRLILKTEAEIVVVSDDPNTELADMERAGKIKLRPEHGSDALFEAAILCFVATGCKGADAAWHAIAKAAGVVVNVVDYPQLCDALTPSIVDRDPVVVAIGTEGTAPVLGRQIKTQVEQMLEPRLGELARVSGRLRKAVAARVPHRLRREFWRWVFNDAPRAAFAAHREHQAIALIKGAIEAGGAPRGKRVASLTLIETGSGAADLLSLRSVKRLQEADVIYHGSGCGSDILDLARRDAERVCVQRGDDWDQLQLLRQHTLEGAKVVWLLKDPVQRFPALRDESGSFEDVEILSSARDWAGFSARSDRQGRGQSPKSSSPCSDPRSHKQMMQLAD